MSGHSGLGQMVTRETGVVSVRPAWICGLTCLRKYSLAMVLLRL